MSADRPRQRDAFLGQVLPSSLQPGVSYTLEQRLGEGGTAVAYLARRVAPDGEGSVVLKLILPRIVAESDEHALTMITKEAVALGRLNERVPPTPNVVRLLDTGSMGFRWRARDLQLPWLALEYVHGGVEGSSIEKRVEYSVRATGFAFDPDRVVRALVSLASGLMEIHAAGIVHRDMTPGNVLCCGSGETELFKISDFGIARPLGLAVTFGDAVLGTPGYAAPEQFVPKLGIGPESDLFSLACIVYFMLTGEAMFDVRTPGHAVAALQSPERRCIGDSPTLSSELREREAACNAIDTVLSRATAFSPKDRYKNAQSLADSLLPWLRGDSGAGRPSRRWLASLAELHGRELVLQATWMVRHPPGDDRIVTGVAWNAAGQALATTTQGLSFWDGSIWSAITASGVETLGPVRFVERLGPTRWLLGARGHQLFELSHAGLRELFAHPDSRVTFSRATVDFDDVAVLVGERAGEPPELFTLVGRRWLRPLPVAGAQLVTGLTRVDDERWLVTGRGTDASAYAAIYSPLAWELERIPAPPGRALLACASRPDRKQAVAVGVNGAILTFEDTSSDCMTLLGSPDLAAVGIDALGRTWAAGRGRVWSRRSGGEWSCVWEHTAWQPPFVGIMVEVGSVAVMTVDGAVLECQAFPLDKTSPAI